MTDEVSEIWMPKSINLEQIVAKEIGLLHLQNKITATALGNVVTSVENILRNSMSKVFLHSLKISLIHFEPLLLL